MLLEAAKPVIENLQQVYVVHDVVLTDIFWATTPLGTALYGTVDLSMTLKAQSVDEMTIFQGILQQTDFPSVCDVKATDFRLLLQTERGAFLRESNPAADEALLSAYAAEALREMVDNYASYIGYRSDFSFPICVALDEGGGVEGCYADLNGTRRNLNIYFLSSREEIAQRGLQELLSIIAYKLPTVKLSDMAKPPYVCAGVRDYAARPFVAAQSRTRRTTPFAYNPYLQYHCHRACADFLDRSAPAGMNRRHNPLHRIKQQNRCAICIKDRKRYARQIRHKAVGLRQILRWKGKHRLLCFIRLSLCNRNQLSAVHLMQRS